MWVKGKAISNAEITSETKVTSVYVGVPGEFSACVTKSVNLTFPKAKKFHFAFLHHLPKERPFLHNRSGYYSLYQKILMHLPLAHLES